MKHIKKPEPKKIKITFDAKKFQADIFSHRSKLDLTFEQVGNILGMNKGQVHKVEAGTHKGIYISIFVIFCGWMNKSPQDYFTVKS